MTNLMHFPRVLAVAALVSFASLAAAAGDAVKLQVELPKDTTTVEAGDPGIDVQIVGIDAAGERTVFGGRTLEVSATEGDLAVVEAPYKYKYIPPAKVDKPTPVTLRAWFKQTPDVKGEAAIEVVGHRPFERLVIVSSSATQQFGTTMDVEVRGVKADSTTTALGDAKVTLTDDGAGTVAPVSDAVFRLTAPAKPDAKAGAQVAHLHARLVKHPRVVGDLVVTFTNDAPPPGPVPPPAPGTAPPVPPVPAAPAAPAAPKSATKEGEPEGVLWPSGNVKLLVWRTKNDKEEEWSKDEHKMPAPGGELIAGSRMSKLRIEIERDDVKKVELQWYVGDKKGAPIHIDDADKDGRLTTEKGKSGKTHAILICETDESKPVIYDLLLTTAKGEVITEEFVLVRGKDKDGDGKKDKPKKK
jgi:hypothetical protein